MTTIRCDALVIGSTLGALVAGSFLASKRLRTVLVEEEVHAKRPPMLREPFLLTGLEPGGPVDQVLRDVSITMLDRRDLRAEALAFQLLLPGGARIDVGHGRAALAAELAAYSVADRDTARGWLELADAEGDAVRARLLEVEPAALEAGRARRGSRRRAAQAVTPEAPDPPPSLDAFVRCQLDALATARPASPAARALLLRGSRDGVFAPPHAAFGFLDLFRRRFLALHGEVRAAEHFGFAVDRREIGIELPRERIFAKAMVIGVPRAPLARVAARVGSCPRWLGGCPSPLAVPRWMVRAERDALPVGMATRVICADGAPDTAPWTLCHAADPDDARIEWGVVSASGSDPTAALGTIAPFSEGRIVPVDVGPQPVWDLDGSDLRFREPRAPSGLRRRPLVVTVGPEIAPELGFEGEVLGARRTALMVADALGH